MKKVILFFFTILSINAYPQNETLMQACHKLEIGEVIGGELMSDLRIYLKSMIGFSNLENETMCTYMSPSVSSDTFVGFIDQIAQKYDIPVEQFYKFHLTHIKCDGELAILSAMRFNTSVFKEMLSRGYPVNATISSDLDSRNELMLLDYLKILSKERRDSWIKTSGRVLRKDYSAKLCAEVGEGICI